MSSKIFRLGVLVLTMMAFIAIYLAPARVYAATTISLNPAAGASGSQTVITGDGFIGKLATIYWDEKKLVQNVPVSKTGQIQYTFEIPAAPRGTHTVKVTDDSNWENINASTSFTIKPSVRIEPPWARAMTSAIIIGVGFAAEEAGLTATWDGKPLTKTQSKADRSGTWYTNFDVPYAARGEYSIGAHGDVTGPAEVENVVFTVAPFCKATPLTGPVGTKILLTGVGFRAGEDGITCTWDGPILDTNIVAQPTGSFSFVLTVPPSTKGRHILGIYGSSFTPKGIVPDIEFEVTPSISLTPSDLIGSRDLLVEGSGFNASESVAITFDKSNTGVSATTDNKGNFQITFQVPTSPIKEHQVVATGNKGALAQANYISVTLTPTVPQLLYPGPGAKIQSPSSVIDIFSKYIGGMFDRLNGSGQVTTDTILSALNWSVTGEQAGLKYSLQVSRTADFLNPVLSRDGIQSNMYNLTMAELPQAGTYYWRVRASNDTGGTSPWSNNWSFEVLPASNLVLVISITIIVLLLAAIVFGIIALVNKSRYS